LVTKKPKQPELKIVGAPQPTGTQPPRKLGAHGMALWQTVQAEYEIEDVGGVETLSQICGALDRLEAIHAQIDEDGEIILIKGVPKVHPLLRDEIQIRAFIVRGLQRLGIAVEATTKPVGRPNKGFVGWDGNE